jgi:hypothetical protein
MPTLPSQPSPAQSSQSPDPLPITQIFTTHLIFLPRSSKGEIFLDLSCFFPAFIFVYFYELYLPFHFLTAF